MAEDQPVILDQLKDNPIESIDTPDLERYVKKLYADELRESSITLDELIAGAKLARYFGSHDHCIYDDTPQYGRIAPSVSSDGGYLGKRERNAIKIQRSAAFWNEPKDLLVTLVGSLITRSNFTN
ncbi:hypothetical protein GP486_006106 [Trichoglossum hirsutum]|uniref:Uncharacterized protein n=1 Tax=Trichoglossum hirsutum TaxID=265104 RepID=A0A9P8L802_9PEZI|nr:hypothetical protein GP486_006106 [Trichoglossum hirsutum]